MDDSSIAEFSTSALAAGSSAQAATNAFVCLTESNAGGVGTDDRVKISVLGVIASTGEVLYDEFIDSHLRTELEVSNDPDGRVYREVPTESGMKSTDATSSSRAH